MGKGNAHAKAKQIAKDDKALSMLDELETMIEEEEKQQHDELANLKRKMDAKRQHKDLSALEKGTGRSSQGGEPAGRSSQPGAASPIALRSSQPGSGGISSQSGGGAPAEKPDPFASLISELETPPAAPAEGSDGTGGSGGGDSSALDELDFLLKQKKAKEPTETVRLSPFLSLSLSLSLRFSVCYLSPGNSSPSGANSLPLAHSALPRSPRRRRSRTSAASSASACCCRSWPLSLRLRSRRRPRAARTMARWTCWMVRERPAKRERD